MGNAPLTIIIVALLPTLPDSGIKLTPQSPSAQPSALTAPGIKNEAIATNSASNLINFMVFIYSLFIFLCQIH
jgi:hypothetical protein